MRVDVTVSRTETKIAQIKVTSGDIGYELNFVHEEEIGSDFEKLALAEELKKLAKWIEEH